MSDWRRRNIIGVILIVGVLTFGVTVGYPSWKENLGADVPAATVPAGATVKIDGVLWRMRALDMPNPTYSKYDDPQPPGTRLVAFAFDRSRDGKPAALDKGWAMCRATFVDQSYRHWYGQIGLLPGSVSAWTRKQGYDTCNTAGAFAAIMVVPEDADITAVDVEFAPEKGSAKKYRFVRFTPPS